MKLLPTHLEVAVEITPEGLAISAFVLACCLGASVLAGTMLYFAPEKCETVEVTEGIIKN